MSTTLCRYLIIQNAEDLFVHYEHLNKALCRYYEQKAPEPLTIPRPQDCAHGVLNISNPVGDDEINNGDDCNVLILSSKIVTFSTITDVRVQGAKLQ